MNKPKVIDPNPPLRVAIIGTAKRSSYLYGPLVKAMPGVELVGVWGRSQSSVDKLAFELGVTGYTDLDRLIDQQRPDIGIVSVSYWSNGEVGLLAVQHGLNVLLETPIAHDLAEADLIIAEASRQGVKVEVAEQFHRRPIEQIKLKLIKSGLFGAVWTSFNDFAGHGYHGVSVMRSYLGFNARPIRVTGAVREFDLEPYYSRTSKEFRRQIEEQEHGIIEFDDGRLGIYHWTSVGYDSPLRWWRSSRFLAEKGMGVTTGIYPDLDEHLTLLAPNSEAPMRVTLERRYERVDGGALISVVAHTGVISKPMITWDNPFAQGVQGHNPQWHDDEIGVAGCLQSLVEAVRYDTEPSYGAAQARLDQEITLAIRLSSERGAPVNLPL
jgi:predicted dehydrogenase